MEDSLIKEVEDFSADLYAYLWSKHKFRTQSLADTLDLEGYFAKTLDLEKSQPVIKSNFNEDIGKAVLCSQYLLRELCYYFFSHPEKGIRKPDDDILTTLSLIIVHWTCNRNDLFVIFIDTCAIIAEAILYCDANSESPTNPEEAVQLFTFFFDCDLSLEFLDCGGWKELNKVAREKYNHINYFVAPYISRLTGPYGFLTYHCSFIKRLMDSPVYFPVNKTKVCRYCLEQLDDPSLQYFDVLEFYEELYGQGDTCSNELQAGQSTEIASGQTPVSSDEADKEIEALSKSFLCLFVGKMDFSEETKAGELKKRLRDRINLKRKVSLDVGSTKRKFVTI